MESNRIVIIEGAFDEQVKEVGKALKIAAEEDGGEAVRLSLRYVLKAIAYGAFHHPDPEDTQGIIESCKAHLKRDGNVLSWDTVRLTKREIGIAVRDPLETQVTQRPQIQEFAREYLRDWAATFTGFVIVAENGAHEVFPKANESVWLAAYTTLVYRLLKRQGHNVTPQQVTETIMRPKPPHDFTWEPDSEESTPESIAYNLLRLIQVKAQ